MGSPCPGSHRLSWSCLRGMRSCAALILGPTCSRETAPIAGGPLPALSSVHVWLGLLLLLFMGHRRKHRLLLGLQAAARARAQAPSHPVSSVSRAPKPPRGLGATLASGLPFPAWAPRGETAVSASASSVGAAHVETCPQMPPGVLRAGTPLP